jgi:hypothetical protein
MFVTYATSCHGVDVFSCSARSPFRPGLQHTTVAMRIRKCPDVFAHWLCLRVVCEMPKLSHRVAQSAGFRGLPHLPLLLYIPGYRTCRDDNNMTDPDTLVGLASNATPPVLERFEGYRPVLTFTLGAKNTDLVRRTAIRMFNISASNFLLTICRFQAQMESLSPYNGHDQS